MCQTALISRNMVRMSKRTYSHMLEVVTPNMYRVGQLARLNRDLDALYELVYDQWRTVTEEDYKVFGGQFKVLLETIKDLYNACRKAPKELGLKVKRGVYATVEDEIRREFGGKSGVQGQGGGRFPGYLSEEWTYAAVG